MAINKPSIEELKAKTSSAYTLVVEVAKRTRELVGGARPFVEEGDKKPIAIAIEEIYSGAIVGQKKSTEEV